VNDYSETTTPTVDFGSVVASVTLDEIEPV
jgi:hypothetical protein